MVGMVDPDVDRVAETCAVCLLQEEPDDSRDTVLLEHPAFERPVMADRDFAEACGGRAVLAARIATTIGDPSAVALPMGFVFARGRGEEYRLHVAHIGILGDSVTVRRFRPDDAVVNRFRLPRSRQPRGFSPSGAGGVA